MQRMKPNKDEPGILNIEVILSPDLQLAEKREQAKLKRLVAAVQYKVGDHVKAGVNGKPGILENISPEGFASIRWPDGSILCGVCADELQREDKL